MALPQPGIFALGTDSHAYLEFDLLADADQSAAVALAAGLREPRTTIGGVNLVTGFRPELWATVAPDAAPDDVRGFDQALVGPDGYTFPATQHDVVMWLAGAEYDVVFDLSREIVKALAPFAKLAQETVGWQYHHDRDLTGFIDGTENPTLVEATEVAIIQPGQRGEGGTILLLQKWEHNALAWESLPTELQERVLGRKKPDSTELDPKPPASHVGRTDQDRLGKIFRRNVAYGSVDIHGTMFVGFCARQKILDQMLKAMLGTDGGPRDDLTKFTQPITGAYYVVPSADRLAAFGLNERADDTTPDEG
jgi:putative iron-dependent peroxidase